MFALTAALDTVSPTVASSPDFSTRIGHAIGRETLAECRRRGLAGRHALEEVGELVDERVLVADLQSRHPPVLHVRMIAIR